MREDHDDLNGHGTKPGDTQAMEVIAALASEQQENAELRERARQAEQRLLEAVEEARRDAYERGHREGLDTASHNAATAIEAARQAGYEEGRKAERAAVLVEAGSLAEPGKLPRGRADLCAMVHVWKGRARLGARLAIETIGRAQTKRSLGEGDPGDWIDEVPGDDPPAPTPKGPEPADPSKPLPGRGEGMFALATNLAPAGASAWTRGDLGKEVIVCFGPVLRLVHDGKGWLAQLTDDGRSRVIDTEGDLAGVIHRTPLPTKATPKGGTPEPAKHINPYQCAAAWAPSHAEHVAWWLDQATDEGHEDEWRARLRFPDGSALVVPSPFDDWEAEPVARAPGEPPSDAERDAFMAEMYPEYVAAAPEPPAAPLPEPDIGPHTEPPPGGTLYIHDWCDGVGARARYQVRFAGETWYDSPEDAARALAEYRAAPAAAAPQGEPEPAYVPKVGDPVTVLVPAMVASVAVKGAVLVEVDSGYAEDDADVRLWVWPRDLRPTSDEPGEVGGHG